MKSTVLPLAAVLGCLSVSLAQTTLDPSVCLKGSGVTAFTNCNYLYDTINKCNSTSTETDFTKCFCNQSLFNSIFGCESEQRLCFGNGNLDSQAQNEVDTWHSVCDKKISFTPTTPPVSSITAPYTVQYCNTVFSSCASGASEQSKCHTMYSSASDRLSCLCQPKILSLAYTCEFLGNATCLQTSAALSNIPGYSYCPGFQTALRGLGNTTTHPTAIGVSTATTSSAIGSSISATKPALPGGTTTSSSSASPTQRSAGLRAATPHHIIKACMFVIMIIAL